MRSKNISDTSNKKAIKKAVEKIIADIKVISDKIA